MVRFEDPTRLGNWQATPRSYQIQPVFPALLRSLVNALLIGTGIFFGHVKLVPSFERYSLEWDSRHQHIIEARDRGLSTVTVAPLSFDLANYVGTRVIQNDKCSLQYYELDAIVLEES